MRNIDARARIITENIDKVRVEYIKDKVKSVNYTTPDGKKKIAFHDVRKNSEKPYIEAQAENDWNYYVVGNITQAEHQKIMNEIDEQMQIAVYDENEKQGNKYPKLKIDMESIRDGETQSPIEKLKEKAKTHKFKVK